MKTTTIALFSGILLAAGLGVSEAQSSLMTVEGTTSSYPPDFDEWAASLGTFNPSFNPWNYSYVYGVDPLGNMGSPNYSRAVSDGNFIPIQQSVIEADFGESDLEGVFNFSFDTSGRSGQHLWIFLFNNANPDSASRCALFSGTDASWYVPSGGGSSDLDANSANLFIFGEGGRGNPINLTMLPFPEPSSLALFSAGLAIIALRSWRHRGRKS